MITFSIIIPIYNASKYLEVCIKSVLAQTYKNFELILVNDGSTDNSLEIAKEFQKKDNRIIVLNKRNGGVSETRNYGLDFSRGEYILFVDADDFISQECLYNYKVMMAENKLDICFQNFKFCQQCLSNKSIKELTDIESQIIKQNDFLSFFFNQWILLTATWSKCFNAKIIKKYHIRFLTSLTLYEDFVFTATFLSYALKIGYNSYKGYNYRVVLDSLSRKRKNINEYLKLFRLIGDLELWKVCNNEYVRVCITLFSKLQIDAFYRYFNHGDKQLLCFLLKKNKVQFLGKKFKMLNWLIRRKFPDSYINAYLQYHLALKRINLLWKK